MKKPVLLNYGGKNARVDQILVNRLLPGSKVVSIGPFVFLDHIYPAVLKSQPPKPATGSFAHPHRGIVTFSYLFSGELEHFDSRGSHGIVKAGGAQWMKAGSGILHDEQHPAAFQQRGGLFHGVQFWINLPAKNKTDAPEYQAILPADIPELQLPADAGILRVLIGSCGVKQSPVKTYSKQFIYHIVLNPKSGFTLNTKAGVEYAAFTPANMVNINGVPGSESQLLVFEPDDNDIELYNPGIIPANVLIFGGEPYNEPIVARGPFVMNTHAEIATAYNDFFEGRYGTINYQHN